MSDTQTRRQIVVTDADIKDLARWLYAREVQDSKLDLMQYDGDPRQQKVWAEQAEKHVEGEITIRRAAGEAIEYHRVTNVPSIPFSVNPVIPTLRAQAAELFQDTAYTWTGATFLMEFKADEIGEDQDVAFLYFQGRDAAGDIVWMDANGMDELSQDDVDGFLGQAA